MHSGYWINVVEKLGGIDFKLCYISNKSKSNQATKDQLQEIEIYSVSGYVRGNSFI